MKIFFSDVDGTFLQDFKIPKENIEAVQKIEAAGHRFVFVSGRGVHDLQEILAEAKIDCDYIYGNGAGYRSMGQQPILKHIIPRTDYDQLEAIFKNNNAFYYVHTNKGLVMQHMEQIMHHFDYLQEEYRKLFGERMAQGLEYGKQYYRDHCHFVDDPFTYLREHEDVHAIKFEVMNGEADIRQTIAELVTTVGYFAFNSLLINLEIVPAETNKANGIKDYLENFTDIEQTFGFGDAMNDLAMFEAVHIAIAVANAKPELKAIADVVLDNEEMGTYIMRELL